jgi:hypothetical protein
MQRPNENASRARRGAEGTNRTKLSASDHTSHTAAWGNLYGRSPLEVEAATQSGTKRCPYFGEVAEAMRTGNPNVYLFAGPKAWDRARRRRTQHGPGSALILPDDENPLDLRWPAVDALMVVWPDSGAYRRKLLLGQALVRDGVRYACIEHEPKFLEVWVEGGRRG